MGKWRKRHWIESKAIEAARFADKMEADDIAFQSYVYNLRRIGLTPYDIHDTVSSFAIPSQFLSDGKQLFIFDKDAADMIGKTSGLPDLREVLKSVPYKTFAVDLGNEKGFYFVSGEVSKDKTVASEYGVDQRDDKYMVDRPTFYETENGQKIGFNWTPVSKNNDDDGPDDGIDIHEYLNTVNIMKTEFIENIVAYICCRNAEIETIYKPRPEGPTRRRESSATWHEVGFRIGAELRAYERMKSERGPHKGGTVRPHMRRAHWHHFWTGPRDGERKLVLKWVPPIMVAVKNGEIGATGHRVPVGVDGE